MNVEFTGRQYEITPNVRKEVETGLNKIRKILGDKFETKVVLAVEKHRHKAEITITPRNGPIVGLAQATDMLSAVNEALDHLHKQALKYKTKWLSKKRKASKKFDGNGRQETLEAAVGLTESTAVSVTVHKFPAVAKTTEVHLVHSKDSVALRPMTLEGSNQRSPFSRSRRLRFPRSERQMMVLHRTREGKMEMIEAP